MHRHNIDTQNGDLIQIDLDNDWVVRNNHEKILLTLINFSSPPPTEDGPFSKSTTIVVLRRDLENLRDKLQAILPPQVNDTN